MGGVLTSLVFVRYDLRSDRLLYFVHLCHVTLFSTSWGREAGGWDGVINVLGLRPSRPAF